MITRKDGRKIADKIADPTRPTWEEYKRVNEDKLDMVGQEIRKMTEYRAELDRERDLKLAERREKKRKLFASDSEDSVDEEEEEGNGHDEGNDKKKKKKTKKLKKEKKKKEKVSDNEGDLR